MKQNIYDGALEGIGEIIEEVSDSIAAEFKGANPFDKEPISNKERLLQYSEFTPEKEMLWRQEFGDEAVDNYILQNEELLRRQK